MKELYRVKEAIEKVRELEIREAELICLEMQLEQQKKRLQNFTSMLENRLHRIITLLKKGNIGRAIKETYKLINSLKQSTKKEKINTACEYAKVKRYMYQYRVTFDEAMRATGAYFGGNLSREDFYAGLKEEIEKLREKHMQHYTPEY